ncbi:hypothetical protein V3C99_011609 [Haemonchus contortus]
MDDNNYDRHFRLLICGGKGTGKSTLLSCFSFESDRSEGTTMLRLDDLNIRIDVRKRDKWQREYVSEFDAVVIIFAADDFKSFDYALEVLRSVQNCDFLPVVVIENKIDLIDEYNFLNKDVIENSIRQARTRLYRVSAKQDFNVMHPFAYVLEKLLRYSDENANVKEKDSLQNGRLSCRQGWIERSTSTSSRKRNANCSIM